MLISAPRPIPPEVSAITAKLQSDILFLEDRLEKLNAQQTPNTAVLKTYREMLESRLQVLEKVGKRKTLAAVPQ